MILCLKKIPRERGESTGIARKRGCWEKHLIVLLTIYAKGPALLCSQVPSSFCYYCEPLALTSSFIRRAAKADAWREIAEIGT
jgi:hypothetical protein